MFFLGRQDKEMRLDIARAGAPLRATARSLLFPSHVCTIHEEEGSVAPVGPLAPLVLSSDSTLRRSSTESRSVWTAPRYSLITHAALRGRNRPIFRGAGHGGPRAQVPFVHTTGFMFFRRHAAPMAPMRDHPIKSGGRAKKTLSSTETFVLGEA